MGNITRIANQKRLIREPIITMEKFNKESLIIVKR